MTKAIMIFLFSVMLAAPCFGATTQTAPPKKAPTPAPAKAVAPVEPEIFFGMSANLSLVRINLATRKYTLGVEPGLAFGFQWQPAWWKATASLLGLDLLIWATFEDMDSKDDLDYFQITAIPVLTLIGAVSAGVGATYSIALKPGAKDTLAFIFSFGLSTPVEFQQ